MKSELRTIVTPNSGWVAGLSATKIEVRQYTKSEDDLSFVSYEEAQDAIRTILDGLNRYQYYLKDAEQVVAIDRLKNEFRRVRDKADEIIKALEKPVLPSSDVTSLEP
jgi:hypothetical protein